MRQNGDLHRTAHKHAFCRDCGYCLAGLSDCYPECGRAFDPADPSSYEPPPAKRAVMQFVHFSLVVFVFLLFVCVLCVVVVLVQLLATAALV